MSGLLAVINEGLTGSGLLAQDSGGVVLIAEASSPWLGGNITSSSLPVAVLATVLYLPPAPRPAVAAGNNC
jgi:hypothetical protein